MMFTAANITGKGNFILTGSLSFGQVEVLIQGTGLVQHCPSATLTTGSLGTLSRLVNNSGAINLGGATLTLSNGTIANLAGGIVSANTPGNVSTISGPVGSANRITNSGTIAVASQTLQVNVPFSNTGTVDVSAGGTLIFNAPVTQVIGPALSHGAWAIHSGSTLSIPGASITNNAANINLDGVGSSFSAINPIATNSGTFQITGGRNFTTSASYTNSGQTVVGTSSALTITGDLNNTGTIDVGGVLIVDYATTSPLATIASQIASGYASGAWNGIGINSTPAALVAADQSALHKTGLGYADASALGIVGTGTVAGVTVDDTAVVIRYTLAGDANLDGQVNTLDFAMLAGDFGSNQVDQSGTRRLYLRRCCQCAGF